MKKYLKFISRSKGLIHVPHRTFLILKRFGVTDTGFKQFAASIKQLTDEYHFRPTLCITAVLIKRYPQVLERLEAIACEVAVHGYSHTDYSQLDFETQSHHMKMARQLLMNGKTREIGFRAPYLSWNRDTLAAIKTNAFRWSSNQTILWDMLRLSDYQKREIGNYRRVMTSLYKPQMSSDVIATPYFSDGLLEIPISLPDDESLIDRLRIFEPGKLYDIWHGLLLNTHREGEHFNLLLHPERAPIHTTVLENLVKEIRKKHPTVWIASLGEIANWWKEKNSFRINVAKTNSDHYEVNVSCTDRATLLAAKELCPSQASVQPFNDGFYRIQERRFVVKTKTKPVIGISSRTSPTVREFLENEGYPFEVKTEGEAYALSLDHEDDLPQNQTKIFLSKLEKSLCPLVKFGRWPNHHQSALSATYDVDSITLQDFVYRWVEF